MTDFAWPDSQKSLLVAGGVTYSYVYIKAQDDQPTVLFLHGFPETSYDWHHQIKYSRSKGMGVLAPDLLGYGLTDKPRDKQAYRLKLMCEQVLSIADHERLDKVIGVGHDWGSQLLSRMSAYYPERFLGYAFVAVGYTAPQGRFDAAAMNAMIEPMLGYAAFGYFMFFDESDAAKLLEQNPASTESLLFGDMEGHWAMHVCPPGAARAWLQSQRVEPLPQWLDNNTVEARRKIFARGGFSGPLNWYKQAQTDVNNADEESLSPERRKISQQPVLLISSTRHDAAIPGEFQKKMTADACQDLRIVEIDSSHWAMLHKPDEVNRALEVFFEELSGRHVAR